MELSLSTVCPNSREHFRSINYKVIDDIRSGSPAFELWENPAYPDAPARFKKEHNEYIYREVLRFTDEGFVDLMVAEVID